MTKIPLPGPVDPDDYPDDYDPDAEAWDSALDWARKGDYKPMIECLRFNPAAPPDPMAVRNFLADVLDGKKKPRHSEKRDAERVAFVDAKGRRLTIEKRHLKQATAIKRVKEMQSKGHRQAEAIVRDELPLVPSLRRVLVRSDAELVTLRTTLLRDAASCATSTPPVVL